MRRNQTLLVQSGASIDVLLYNTLGMRMLHACALLQLKLKFQMGYRLGRDGAILNELEPSKDLYCMGQCTRPARL